MIGAKPKPSARPRPGGGMNAGLGDFGEHLDEAAMAEAAGQQAMNQASSNPLQQAGTQTQSKKSQQLQGNQLSPQSLKQSFIVEPAKDIAEGLLEASGLSFLGISVRKETDPEEEEKKKIIAERYKRMTEEEQELAKKMYQQDRERQRQEEQERLEKQQAEEEARAADVVMPSTPQKGPVGPASGMSSKQKATTKLQQDRQRMTQSG